jgi:hypothetical protein
MNGLLELICASDVVTIGDQTKFVVRVSQKMEEEDTLKGGDTGFEDHDDTFGESMDGEATRGYVDTRDSAAETLDFLTTMTFAAELKKKLFLHLTDILLQVPESCDKFPDVSEFCMDGTGNMVQKVNFDTPKKFHATHAIGWTDTVGDTKFIAVVDGHLYRLGSSGLGQSGCGQEFRVCAYCHWVILLRWMTSQWGDWRTALRDYKRRERADE